MPAIAVPTLYEDRVYSPAGLAAINTSGGAVTVSITSRPVGGTLYLIQPNGNYAMLTGSTVTLKANSGTYKIGYIPSTDFFGSAGTLSWRESQLGLTRSYSNSFSVVETSDNTKSVALSKTTVAENSFGATVGVLSAVDPDKRPITYRITNADAASLFEVATVSGQTVLRLKAGVALDYEAGTSYRVDITAGDGFGASVSRTFTVAVQDVNETITGTASNDSLVGTQFGDTLIGLAGDDWLNGNAGADRMTGGVGNDIYVVDNARDVVIELAGEGTDDGIVTYLGSYTLGAEVEGLAYAGSGNFTGIGNSLDNVLVGNGGADTLVGGAGADELWGMAGADRFVFQDVAESTVTASDTIADFLVGTDKIDVVGVDAIAGGTNDSFAFVGSAAFTAAGQIRVEADTANNVTRVLFETNGDGIADMQILLTDASLATTLTAADFLL